MVLGEVLVIVEPGVVSDLVNKSADDFLNLEILGPRGVRVDFHQYLVLGPQFLYLSLVVKVFAGNPRSLP